MLGRQMWGLSLNNLMYTVGIKRQVINSLRKVFLSTDFPDPELAQRINLELQYPIVAEKYPAIYVNYVDEYVRDSGLGNFYYVKNDLNEIFVARQWFFEGSIGLNVMALDPVERDTLAAILAGMLAFSKDDFVLKRFRDNITSEEFVSLQPNFAFLYGGEESTKIAPWDNKDEFVYSKRYVVHTLGCFFTDPNSPASDLITLDKIRTYPYRPDQSVPTGNQTQPELIPWTSFG